MGELMGEFMYMFMHGGKAVFNVWFIAELVLYSTNN